MVDDYDSFYRSLCFAVAASLALGAGACGDDASPGEDAPPAEQGPILQHPSRSSTIALSDDGALVAMVNPEDGTLSVFQTSDNARLARIPTGGEPSSVVIAADNKTAYVANRADGTVVRVAGIDTAAAAVDATIDVGAEPMGLALSPTGKQLFVAECAESRVSIIDTKTNAVANSFPFDRPRALMVTNNLDTSDADEQLIVAEYFGRPVAGKETKDDGRTGYLRMISLADITQTKGITLAAAFDSGFNKFNGSENVLTSPNQLGAMNIANGRLYVTSVSASPEGPPHFDNNVYPVIYVADLASAAEVRDATGTVNLARKVYDAIPSPSATEPRFIPGELSDIDFVPGSTVGYAIGRAGDVMVRVTFGGSDVQIGSTQNKEIDLGGNDTIGKCQGPTGVVVDKNHTRAYVNCWITKKLGVVDLAAQSMTSTVESAPAPTDATAISVAKGRRFYFTGRGRWSANVANGAKGGEGWSSCGSCHPDGRTDNMTWVFGAGPRQTTSQDGTFSHGAGPQKERLLNWTAIFDEQHDFERNTRDVSGGLGAITKAATPTDCDQLDKESPADIAAFGGLGKPLREVMLDSTAANCGHKDWDDIDNYVKTIAPVRARKTQDAAAVARGRDLFTSGNCAKCHGGSGWTVSRRFYLPSDATNVSGTTNLTNADFTIPSFFPSTFMYNADQQQPTPTKRKLQSIQPAIPQDSTGPADTAVPLGQIACALRNVGTFGVPGELASVTDALELRQNKTRAEGRAGYNVPSLYGLSLGAPYLHHGQSPSLTDLFTNDKWQFHTNAGNAIFSLSLNASSVSDLIAFLTTIDATTPEFSMPNDTTSGGSFDACPLQFP